MLWTVAHQAPPSMGFSRKEYWSGLPCPPPGDLPDSGTELKSPTALALQVDSLPLSHWGSPLLRCMISYLYMTVVCPWGKKIRVESAYVNLSLNYKYREIR